MMIPFRILKRIHGALLAIALFASASIFAADATPVKVAPVSRGDVLR